MKITKAQARLHAKACNLLTRPALELGEREFVLENWRPDAEHDVARMGAFFTPLGLAEAFAHECTGAQSVIDLCAGIGGLSYQRWLRDRPRRMVCVESNPAFVAVGKKVLPEATWIQADVFALPGDLGLFDLVISNPPFGHPRRPGIGPRYRGGRLEFRVIDVASTLAEQGVFLLPQSSSPRTLHDECAHRSSSRECARFEEETGIALDIGIGIDGSEWAKEWRGTRIVVESVRADFKEQNAGRWRKAA